MLPSGLGSWPRRRDGDGEGLHLGWARLNVSGEWTASTCVGSSCRVRGEAAGFLKNKLSWAGREELRSVGYRCQAGNILPSGTITIIRGQYCYICHFLTDSVSTMKKENLHLAQALPFYKEKKEELFCIH